MDMDKKTVDKLVLLAKEWNLSLGRYHEKEMAGVEPGTMGLTPDLDFMLRNSLMNSLQNWTEANAKPLTGSELSDLTSDIRTADDGMQVLEAIVPYCDREIPDFILVALGALGMEVVDRLRALVDLDDLAHFDKDEKGELRYMALTILGQWQDVELFSQLAAAFARLKTVSEPLFDGVYRYAVELGDNAVDGLMKALDGAIAGYRESRKPLGQGAEILIYVLADLTKEAQLPEVYDRLRAGFKALKNKTMGILALQHYGDRRAVTLIRQAVLEAGTAIDAQLYYTAMEAIRELGGQTDDLPHPVQQMPSVSPKGR